MAGESVNSEALSWIEVICSTEQDLIREITAKWTEYRIIFIDRIAGSIYSDIRSKQHCFTSPWSLKKDFATLTDSEKALWLDFARNIPAKLQKLNLFIRPCKEFCRTCLIPYREMEALARADYIVLGNRKAPIPFSDLPEGEKRFYIELNHLVPVALKKAGYEIIRTEEVADISERVVVKFARAIHAQYLREIRKSDTGAEKSPYLPWIHNSAKARGKIADEFDELPEDIRHSNLDNAYQIPAKLLSVGYKIRQAGKGHRPAVLRLNVDEIETMARVEHIRWCWDKILHGWTYGKTKDERKKTHPSIIPYEDLSEPEKEKDRELVRLIPALLHDVNYEALHVNPDKYGKLPYALRQQSSISRILDETRRLNEQIRKLVTLAPEVEELTVSRNRKIEEALKEIEASYNYALHIQKSFLPDNLYVRECFPDSFILFKPRDIVSGDFYFFSRQGRRIVFAAADCTGHGIPGALLTTIGYGILDEAVNTLQLADPREILKHLYHKMHRFLKTEREATGISDDLDIALCCLETKKRTLTYSGVGIPLYHIRDGVLSELRPGGSKRNPDEDDDSRYTSESVTLKHGDAIYLLSDGYTDQFGGKSRKRYQTGRFKNLLLSIRDISMPEQGDILAGEMERWMEEQNEAQTDDILVIGIRI